MKKITTYIAATTLTLLSVSAFACPKGTTLTGGTGPNHKGGKCVAVTTAQKTTKASQAATVTAQKTTKTPQPTAVTAQKTTKTPQPTAVTAQPKVAVTTNVAPPKAPTPNALPKAKSLCSLKQNHQALWVHGGFRV